MYAIRRIKKDLVNFSHTFKARSLICQLSNYVKLSTDCHKVFIRRKHVEGTQRGRLIKILPHLASFPHHIRMRQELLSQQYTYTHTLIQTHTHTYSTTLWTICGYLMHVLDNKKNILFTYSSCRQAKGPGGGEKGEGICLPVFW